MINCGVRENFGDQSLKEQSWIVVAFLKIVKFLTSQKRKKRLCKRQTVGLGLMTLC